MRQYNWILANISAAVSVDCPCLLHRFFILHDQQFDILGVYIHTCTPLSFVKYAFVIICVQPKFEVELMTNVLVLFQTLPSNDGFTI